MAPRAPGGGRTAVDGQRLVLYDEPFGERLDVRVEEHPFSDTYGAATTKGYVTYGKTRDDKVVTIHLAIQGRMRVATTHPHRRVQWRRVDASEEENSYLFSLSEKPFSRACEPRVLQIMEPDLEEAPHNNMFIFATADERRAGRRMFNPSQGTSGGTGGWRGRGGGEGWSDEEEEGEEAAAARGSGSGGGGTSAEGAADAASGGTSTSGGTAEAAFGPALPTVRTKAGREREEGMRAGRREAREAARRCKEAARRHAVQKRCAQSKAFWCRCDVKGHPRCNFAAQRRARWPSTSWRASTARD